ncbi:hypothetical protein [Arthrobacter sp. H20]|uniref:hypothetical protein n=1 Tax=Arthrobacter sp. H20 TaxID=1267981 RepID=UPI0004B7A847|nr:hypothetical protein [Arthrobacter sp. H20]
MYSDADAASLYAILNPWDASDELYVPFGMSAESVLDVGCGNGGYVARRRTEVEWVEGTATASV